MAFVDITGSVLVLLMWQSANSERLVSDRIREMNYSIAIGSMMIFLGIFLIVDSIIKLRSKNTPSDSSLMGTVDGMFGFFCGISLFLYKYFVGKALDSPVVIADSISSLCSGLTSFAALLVVILDETLWWIDSTAGFFSALYTLYSGAHTIISSYSEISKLRQEQGPTKKRFIKKNVDYGSDDSRRGSSSSSSRGGGGGNGDKKENKSSSSSSSIVKKLYKSFPFFGSSYSSQNQDYDKIPLTESVDYDEEIIFDA